MTKKSSPHLSPHQRTDYAWFTSISTTAVNQCLIQKGVLDIHKGLQIGLVIETGCNYFAPLAYPQKIDAGIRVAKMGNSSVRYEVGLFAEGALEAAAQGHFVHVYVNKITRRPEPLATDLRAVLETLLIEEAL
jgi:acyl-CoA thioester hydrolase